VLVPSRWDEVCPYSVLDAIAAGVPVLASDRGGLPELVGPDAALPATDVDAWAAALRRLWREPAKRAPYAEGARERFGEERYLRDLLAVYG
jgi:glycosyltransferase involved in cell wall biosynthesis